MTKHLQVILYERVIGTLIQGDGGQHTFTYADPNTATPLSLSMPPRTQPYPHRIVEPFLEGLLPEKDDVRSTLGEKFGVSSRNPFALLEHLGLDCAGAVQFAADAQVDDVLAGKGSLERVEPSIGARLRALRDNPASWVADNEHWSLAGAQSKFALRRTSGGWRQATGAEPTSHIFKPGVQELMSQALIEHICLRTARAVGLSAAETEYKVWDSEPAIVVTRYDRTRTPQGAFRRIHQEDICQAMSVYPRDKYESDGGPSAADVIALLRRSGDRAYRGENMARFTDGLLFNYLIGAPDAHAKNYSIVLLGDIVRLAPLYDVASGLAYEHRHQPGLGEGAMSIGGERRFGRVERRHLEAFAAATGQDAVALVDRTRELAAAIPEAMANALEEESVRTHTAELRDRLLVPVASLCATTIRQLDSPASRDERRIGRRREL
ncbi:type II toxin-antitoxin system HipA family toxin [Pengzhenrongella sp.]|jgi:serine/threonine-protein kinase HipA|uniref:type II toxin-antitoxin system HipA family toxin n=1 Tax=Pengzhenrongella sp. TaxID=2888820 RepID=UPI002F94B691